MCNVSCMVFGARNLTREEVKGKSIIEIGSYNVNGNLRAIIDLLEPAEYIGADIEKGQGVDVICDAEKITDKFGLERFDIVISTELLEHVRDWRKVISNMKNVCKPNGIILISTRSYGFKYHAYPSDFWRFEIEDMEHIFSDCEILTLKKDNQAPGVFIKAKKPSCFIEKDLSPYKLYNIIVNKRVKEITEKAHLNLYFFRLMLKLKIFSKNHPPSFRLPKRFKSLKSLHKPRVNV